MEAHLSFRPCIACRRDADHPPHLLMARASELKVQAAHGTSTLCESYMISTWVKPFFDFDGHGTEVTDDEQMFDEVCAPPIRAALGVRLEQLAVASRLGWLPDSRPRPASECSCRA